MNYHLAIVLLITCSMIIFSIQVSKESFFSEKKRTGFVFTAILICVASITEYIGYNSKGPETVLSTIVEFSVSPLIAFSIAKTLTSRVNQLRLITSLIWVNFALEITSPATKLVYYYDENFEYHRGKFYSLYLVVTFLSIAFAMYEIFRVGKKYQTHLYRVIVYAFSVLVVCIVCQTTYPSMIIIKLWLSMLLGIVYIFYFSLKYKIDGLTSVFNQQTWIIWKQNSRRVKATYVIIDVNRFKHVNDTYGHPYGDECLMTVARILKETFYKNGKVFRIGGDEFAVILPRVFAEAEIKRLLQIVDSKVDEKRKESKDNRFPILDWGYCVFNPATSSLDEAVEFAEKKMYEMKLVHHKLADEANDNSDVMIKENV